MVKLIACDVDGTLLPDGTGNIDEEVPELIRKLRQQGRYFIAASGRQYPNLKRVFAPVRDEISYICENGALVIHKQETLFRYQLARETGQRILKTIMAAPGAEALLSGLDTCYIQPKSPDYASHLKNFVGNTVTVVDDITATTEDYIKISVYEPEQTRQRFAYWQEFFRAEKDLYVVTSGNGWIDVIPYGIDKGSALKIIGDTLQVGAEEMMAIGDNFNDLPMFDMVDYSVVMSDSHEDVKKHCRYQTDTVTAMLKKVLEGQYD